MIVSLMELNMI